MATLKLKSNSINSFFAELYASSAVTFILANTVTGDNAYEYHMILEKFSNKINKKIGSIQKCWQGLNNKVAPIDMIPACQIPSKDKVCDYLHELHHMINDDWKSVLGDEPIIEDEVLELLAHIIRTVQILERLKK